jgi:lipid-A-disaccharide synthase
MVIAGEASGDLLAAELVAALREAAGEGPVTNTQDQQPLRATLEPRFFGAGGPRMAEAGVELAFDLTTHSVVGISGVVRNLLKFRRLLRELLRMALHRQPDVIVCVDFSGFNRLLAAAVRKAAQAHSGIFNNWRPKIVQFVSPQVWASRESRVYQIAQDYDLLLCIFPFEKNWYAKRVPGLRVEFVGHPMVERFAKLGAAPLRKPDDQPKVVLLPGSRPAELRRHVPIVTAVARKIAEHLAATFCMVLPSEELVGQFVEQTKGIANLSVQAGRVESALRGADLAITKSGTITMECAFSGVPALVFYQTTAVNYWIGKRIVKVKYLAMPNLLADEPLFPEFIQHAATPENISKAAIYLLQDRPRRERVQQRLREIVTSLGTAGAPRRAAQAIMSLFFPPAQGTSDTR